MAFPICVAWTVTQPSLRPGETGIRRALGYRRWNSANVRTLLTPVKAPLELKLRPAGSLVGAAAAHGTINLTPSSDPGGTSAGAAAAHGTFKLRT